MQVDVAEEALTLVCAMAEDPQSSPCLEYEKQWAQLLKLDLDMTGLREQVLDGSLRVSRFRSVVWRLLLGALTPGYPHSWTDEVRTSRKHYRGLRSELEVTPCSHAEPDRDNPLSQHEKSSWHQYFCDKELKCLIRQDVIRTFPGVDFFRSDAIQEAMINILFCYARENPTMCYRQGMHEVLAPVIFVVHCDHQALLHTQEQLDLRSDIMEILDPAYLEDDSYTLFRRIMNAIEGSYLIPNITPSSTGYFPCQASATTAENQVISQLNWIKERLLATNDPELNEHLEKLDISLPLFGIRWLRLLFGREFPLEDLLVLWDAIFADNKSFDLVNYIVVAMLSGIRSILLNSDYNNCLSTLMRYPGAMDISIIIEYALHLKYPSKYKIPVKFLPVKNRPEGQPLKKANKVVANGPTNRRLSNERNSINSRMKQLELVNESLTTRPVDKTVVEGFMLCDPELLAKELQHAHSIMSLCSLKLRQYHEALENSVDSTDGRAYQALTGIQELSTLLADNIKHPFRVEPAFEARERPSPGSPSSSSSLQFRPPVAVNPSRSSSTKPLPNARPKSTDLQVFRTVEIPINESEEDESNGDLAVFLFNNH